MSELKPCPFCGSKAAIEQTGYGTTNNDSCNLSFLIKCRKCGATVPDSCGFISLNLSSDGELNTWHDDRKRAIEAWNRRAET